MITIDQHSKDQNNIVLPADWHQNMDSADPAILSVNPSALSYSQDDSPIRPQSARPVEPVTPADAVDPIPALSNQNPSPETPGDLLSAPNDDNETSSSLSPAPSPNAVREHGTNEVNPEATGDVAADDPTHSSPQGALPAAVSRQSTPLTELSGPMTPSRGKDDEVDRPEDGVSESNQQAGGKLEGADGEEADGKSDGVGDAPVAAVKSVKSGRSPSILGESAERDTQGKTKVPEKGAVPAGEGPAQLPAAAFSSIPSSSQSQLNGVASSVSADPHNSQPPGSSTPQSQKIPQEAPDEKASTILQLNAELLK